MKAVTSTHLRGGYLLRSPLLWSYLSTTDALLRASGLTGRRGSTPIAQPEPRRLLLAIGGHLGDAIITSRAIQLIRASFPKLELGIAAPSWSKVVLENEPAIRWFHTLDHWRVNRSRRSVVSKMQRYARTWRTARSEIASVGYDVALDLYPYYPNMAGLLWSAGVPRRFGFATGGRASLYTATAEWLDDRCHIAEKQLRLVKLAFPEIDESRAAAPRLPSPTQASVAAVARLLAANRMTPGEPYVILHAGAGASVRLWPLNAWRQLAEQLTRTMTVVVTGVGAAEEAAAELIGRGLDRCVNLAGKLSWGELEALVDGAAAVVAGETSLGHLAAAHRTPGVAIYTGITDSREWRPLGAPDVPLALLTESVPCAPCYRPEGCSRMACVRDVSVDRVMTELRRILGSRDIVRSGGTLREKNRSF